MLGISCISCVPLDLGEDLPLKRGITNPIYRIFFSLRASAERRVQKGECHFKWQVPHNNRPSEQIFLKLMCSLDE